MIVTIAVLMVSLYLFVTFAPQFGANKPTINLDKIEKANNYYKGRFSNKEYMEQTKMDREKFSIWDFFFKTEGRVPDKELPVMKVTSFNNYEENPKVTWFGHSSILIEIKERKIMIDPMFSDHASPIPHILPKRFGQKRALKAEELPKLDAVLISHDHYDHLDYKTIKVLKEKVKDFYVPLGIGSHLKKWGVEESRIHEMEWWEEFEKDGLFLAFTPTKHFSGRNYNNSNSTLWGSWVIKDSGYSFYFSGDSGYQLAFKKIGNKYGPFDLTMIETGQYNVNWIGVHMLPEQSVQAHIDLKGKLMLPIHWGAFTLSTHTWNEPAIRATKEAEKRGVSLITPMLGGSVILDGKEKELNRWWK